MTRLRLNTLRALSLLGLAVSVYLVRQHIEFELTGDPGGLCSLVKAFDCSAIEASAFSEIGPVPVASLGVVYFVILAAFFFTARADDFRERHKSDMQAVASLFAFMGLLASIVLALISAIVIRGFCLGCTIVYFITLAIAALVAGESVGGFLGEAIAGVPASLRIFRSWLPRDDVWVTSRGRTLALWIVLLIAPVAFAFPSFWIGRSRESVVLNRYLEQPLVELQMGEHALAQGDSNAPLQIVVFTDFECPFCKQFDPQLKNFLANYEGQYRLVIKHFPFDSACNPRLKPESPANHPRACRLAEMAQALGAMGKFWEAGGELYHVPAGDLYPGLKAIAERAGVDYSEWAARAVAPATREQVQSDIEEGLRLGIAGIPTIYLNGRAIPTPRLSDMKIIFDSALRDS